jgi:DNA-binding SARP family transcriptional activator/WD40 repeat protein
LVAREHGETRRSMQIRLLGHVEASVDERPVALGGAKQRAVLAMLGLEPNRAVSADRLIEGLWGEQPPPSAAKMVQNYVWRLRGALADDGGTEILTRGRAYELRIDTELVDVCRLERLVSEAARAAEAGQPSSSARAALALFRGDPLADVADEPFAIGEIRRLEELRLVAFELAIDADLAAGRHQELVSEIDALLAENPLRERLHAQRMLALYRCGRQAEALEAYRHARATLVEEIGVEPSPELRRLHDSILRQDAALAIEPAAAELPRALDPSDLPPLIGRDEELRRIRARRQDAAGGAGALVAVVGAYGMGKTRIVAEAAGEAHREGATVLYAAGAGPPEAALATIARTRASIAPTLLVLDDADRASAELRAALRDLVPMLAGMPALVLATGQEAAALARLGPRETVVLEPLDAESVQTIAGFYAPRGEAIPVDSLLATSRGVPRRVHEAAGEWARRQATRRVDVAADRAASGRTEARALEEELAGSVVELQSMRERAGLSGGRHLDAAAVVCPYKGLAAFDADDAEYFFGRERLVAELVARFVGAPLLAVVGPSGSGKSSVVRAGLLPALAGGVLPGSDQWTQALMRPGEHPLSELRRVTRRLSRERRGILAVDQFEELFTTCQDDAERAEFVAALLRASGAGIPVVLAVRADFYGRCAAYPELSRLLGANHVLVGPMSRDELARAIERPAQRVGLSVEPELVEGLLRDVEGQPGALPLLSTALLELWRRRDGRHLRLAAYARSGGVQGAVARLAEDAFLELGAAEQAVARRLLLRLCDEDPSGSIVRRRIALAELDADAAEVAARLTRRRLLTTSEGAVEVAHEALLREWPRLRGWLDVDVEGRRLHRRLSDDARAWEADARDPAGLYRGARLASALEWAADHQPELNATERAFLDEGRRASGRAQRRLRLVLAGVVCLLVLAVLAGVVALEQRGNARAEATAAAAQRLGAQALAEDDLDRALLLAREGLALDDSAQTRSNLFAALLKSPAAIGVLGGEGERVVTFDISPDGRTLAFVDRDGELWLVDAETRRRVAEPRLVPGLPLEDAEFQGLRFSDDGTRLAVGGDQPVVLDTASLRPVAQLRTSLELYRLHFSPDGRTIVAAGRLPRPSSALQRFDARTGERVAESGYVRRTFELVAPIVTPEGARLVTSIAGGPTVIRDARTLRPLRRFTGAGALALSPDGQTLLRGGRDGSVRFLDLVTGATRRASDSHEGAVVRATVAAEGRLAVTAGVDRRVIVWDVEAAAAREVFEGHPDQITGLKLSPDGGTLYSSGAAGKVIVWDVAGERRLGRPFSPQSSDRARRTTFDLSPDGRTLAVGDEDGTVTLTDVASLREISTFAVVPDGPVLSVAFVPGSRTLVVGGEEFLAAVDTGEGHRVTPLPGHQGSVVAPTISADGRRMVTTNLASVVMLWTLRSGRVVGPPRPYSPSGFEDVSLSPDGRTLAVLLPGTGVELVDATTLRRRAVLADSDRVRRFAQFTEDGGHVVAQAGGWVRIWSAKTTRPVGRIYVGGGEEPVFPAMSPDARMLATGSSEGTIRLFDLETRRSVGTPLPGLPSAPVAPLFTPDGAHLVALPISGRAYRWDVRAASWARHACEVAGRTLTRAEFSDVLPGRDYAPACG